MSRIGAAPRAAVPAPGAPPRAATPVSNARAEASRKNGAKSRGPRTPEGRARSAQNALKHGMRAQKYVLLPQEDAVEFAELQRTLFEELAPVGALQTLLARRIAVAAWRLARADRMEAEVLEFRSYEGANAGLALMRDANGTRSIETLMRYRSAAVAELMRALRTLKALQAEQAANAMEVFASTPAAPASRRARPNESATQIPDTDAPNEPATGRQIATPCAPIEPERGASGRLHCVMPEPPVAGRTLHEAAAPWLLNQPETGSRNVARDIGARVPDEPEAARNRSGASGRAGGHAGAA